MAITSLKSTRDFVRIWFFWKIPAILIFCFIVVSICFFSFTATPLYESTAKIMVLPRTNSESLISPGHDVRQYNPKPVNSHDINTEIELLKSDFVIKRTIDHYAQMDSSISQPPAPQSKFNIFDKLKLTKEPLSEYEKKAKILFGALNVDPVLSSNMITVSLKSPYQDQVADVLNQLLEVYMTFRNKTFSPGEREIFYDDQKEYYGKQLADDSKKLKEFKSRWNILNMKSQTDADLKLISVFQTQLKNLEIQIAENQVRLDMLKSGIQVNDDRFIISKEMRSLPIIVELAKGLVPLLIRRTEISKTFTKKSREYKQIDDQIAMLRKEIKNESMAAARTDMLENKTLTFRRNLLMEKLEDLKIASHDFQLKEEEYTALVMDVEIARKNFLKYGEKKEDSRLFDQRDKSKLSNVVITERANTPSRPKSPNKLLALKVSIILGLFAALIFPYILETVDQKLKTSDDVENVLSLPVVCSYNEL